jgi:hypothetical protein
MLESIAKALTRRLLQARLEALADQRPAMLERIAKAS